jgi:hypothetical protein
MGGKKDSTGQWRVAYKPDPERMVSALLLLRERAMVETTALDPHASPALACSACCRFLPLCHCRGEG